MKNLRSVLFALTVLLLATAAQAQTTNVQAKVPFDFVVGDRAYPAGEYTIRSMSDSGIPIRIDATQEDAMGIALSHTCVAGGPATATTLVFHRLGDNYFLYQIWTEGNSAGREFPKSKVEVQVAKNYDKPELVIVAANISR
jgi:hypothetical protein